MDREWLLDSLAWIRATGEYRVLQVDIPPATEEQLLETERRLGFALPEALRILYGEFANGGDILNHGALIFGAVGGCPPLWGPEATSTIDQLVSRSGWRLDAETDAKLQRDPKLSAECLYRPDGFVSFADLGCMITAEWDGRTGRVYSAEAGRNMMEHITEQGEELDPNFYTYCACCACIVTYLAPSVEAFLRDAIEYRLRPNWPEPSLFTALDYEAARYREAQRDMRYDYNDFRIPYDPWAGAPVEENMPAPDDEDGDLPATSYRLLASDEPD